MAPAYRTYHSSRIHEQTAVTSSVHLPSGCVVGRLFRNR